MAIAYYEVFFQPVGLVFRCDEYPPLCLIKKAHLPQQTC
jgi:hypothetical protein